VTEREAAIQALQPMLHHATINGLWLKRSNDGMCFSPAEIHQKNNNNELCWGPLHWELINPQTLIINVPAKLKEIEEKLSKHNEDIIQRMGSKWNLR
jgi:hypothetical protein